MKAIFLEVISVLQPKKQMKRLECKVKCRVNRSNTIDYVVVFLRYPSITINIFHSNNLYIKYNTIIILVLWIKIYFLVVFVKIRHKRGRKERTFIFLESYCLPSLPCFFILFSFPCSPPFSSSFAVLTPSSSCFLSICLFILSSSFFSSRLFSLLFSLLIDISLLPSFLPTLLLGFFVSFLTFYFAYSNYFPYIHNSFCNYHPR